ncbi:hypothetical protein IKH83_00150 [Candidatus Saccharibacteria bacterium]|nr:hypothetical protein [Candidatus Saccharibacteria bacterium]
MDNFSQQPMMSNLPPTPPAQINPVPMQQAPVAPGAPAAKAPSKFNENLKFIIAIVATSVALLIFAVLFLTTLMKYNDAKSDLDEKIDIAVAKAKDEQAEALEAEFAEREKTPYKDFSGPEDYGSLNFKYPKTWSVYIPQDASTGGDFEAYFTPGEVQAISNENVNSLRLRIVNRNSESVKADYQRSVGADGLSPEEISIANTNATHYSGKIPGTEFIGHIVIFKIRDKTAIFQTDSELFADDFGEILDTVSFNE